MVIGKALIFTATFFFNIFLTVVIGRGNEIGDCGGDGRFLTGRFAGAAAGFRIPSAVGSGVGAGHYYCAGFRTTIVTYLGSILIFKRVSIIYGILCLCFCYPVPTS